MSHLKDFNISWPDHCPDPDNHCPYPNTGDIEREFNAIISNPFGLGTAVET